MCTDSEIGFIGRGLLNSVHTETGIYLCPRSDSISLSRQKLTLGHFVLLKYECGQSIGIVLFDEMRRNAVSLVLYILILATLYYDLLYSIFNNYGASSNTKCL